MNNTQMTNEEIAEQYEFLSGHPFLPVRYQEEPRPIPRWMLGLFLMMGGGAILYILAAV